MTPSAKQTLRAFRNDPFIARITARSIDLTGASYAMAVRQYPDAASTYFTITGTSTPGAEGVRLADVDTVDGVIISYVEIIITKAHIQSLPAAAPELAEAGESVELYYELQVTPPAVGGTPWYDNIEQTWLYGPFLVHGSANS